jgi:shikimate dehydrogenase
LEDAVCDLAAAVSLSNGFTVIGDPIGHSLSPQIHGAVFTALGITDVVYEKTRVRSAFLAQAFAAFRAGNAAGFNATIPHKAACAALADELEESAREAGAVNTVYKRVGKIVGSNTDREGLVLALARYGRSYAGKRVVVSGAGGAASGIVSTALAKGAESVAVVCRRQVRNLNADNADSENDTGHVSSLSIEYHIHDFSKSGEMSGELKETLCNADLFLNATPLGMAGCDADYADTAFLSLLPRDAFLYDLVYNPPETKLLQAAKAYGLPAANGLSMLIYQAILADELFLERNLNKDELYMKITEVLHGV